MEVLYIYFSGGKEAIQKSDILSMLNLLAKLELVGRGRGGNAAEHIQWVSSSCKSIGTYSHPPTQYRISILPPPNILFLFLGYMPYALCLFLTHNHSF